MIDSKTCENIRKITTAEGDDYTTGCSLDYTYFKKYLKMTVIDLSNQKVLDVDLKPMEQINFSENLDQAGFFSRNRESMMNLLSFNTILA